MPMPGPISCHPARSRGVAAANRGYQVRGADTTRPSRNATINRSRVTRTSVAVGSTPAEVLMPCLSNRVFVPHDQRLDSPKFCGEEPMVVLDTHRGQPELRRLALAGHVHVHRFAAVAREEEQAVWTALQDRGTHRTIVPAFVAGGDPALANDAKSAARRQAAGGASAALGGASAAFDGMDSSRRFGMLVPRFSGSKAIAGRPAR